MKIVIDDEKIIDLLEIEWGYKGIREDIARVIRENGTPLPKGHGKIGDLDRLYNVFKKNVVSADAFKELFNLAPTIIEADSEE